MSLLLDSGALMAFERGNRVVFAHLAVARANRSPVKTLTAVVAQVWRQGSRQVVLARLLRGIDEVGLSPQRARSIGLLLAAARTRDVVDASLVDLAFDGDEILTSDPGDLVKLAEAAGKTLIITRV